MTTVSKGFGHDDRPRCGGKTTAGGQCTQAAGWGTDHVGIGRCKLHGGNTPSHRKAAERVKAQTAVVTFGLPVEVDPQTALLAELHRSAGAVAWLDVVVRGLEQGDIVWGLVREKVGGDDRGVTHEAGVNVWVRLWTEQRKHLVDVARACVTAGIEERRIQLEQDKARMVALAVEEGLAAIEATPEQRAIFTRTLLARLRLADAVELEAGGRAS